MEINDFKMEICSIMYQFKISAQKFIEPIVESEGLTMIQTYILNGLLEGTITNISSLCKEFGFNQGNVSTICKQMEKIGLIKRNRSNEDERIVTLSLTEEGKQKILKLYARADDFDAVFEQVQKEKLDVIINGMQEFSKLIKLLSEKNKN